MRAIKWENWRESAFEIARKEDKPIFLWVEYFDCAACRKMESESFSNPSIVEIINTQFIAIRVDREERQDIDRRYQRLFTTMTGKEEGWPLSIFIDADKTPLYAASYLPPEARDGLMGLGQIADLIAKRYDGERGVLLEKGREVLSQLTPKQSLEATQIDTEILGKVFSRQFQDSYDETNKGLGDGAKYLHISALQTALDCCGVGRDSTSVDIASDIVDKMLTSKIWDKRYGGFYCCTLDEAWDIPQRKKSVAQNGLMISVLLRLGEIRGDRRYYEAAFSIGEWALKDMRDNNSKLFYHSSIEGAPDTRVFAATSSIMTKAMVELAKTNGRFRPDALESLNALMTTMLSENEIIHQLGVDSGTTFFVDYATMAEALLAADALADNNNFSLSASEVTNAAIRRFYNNGFWGVSDGEYADPVSFVDTDLPSPASTMAMVLGKLGKNIDRSYAQFANQTFMVSSYDLMRKPILKAKMVEAVLLYHS